MGGHEGDGPLRATYRVERPPWIGLYSRLSYNKQPEYWAEPGLKDTIVRAGKFRGTRDTYREEAKDFYDPKVPDGTSLSGPNGIDSTRTTNTSLKGDQPGNLYDWQRKTMEGSLQYKQIMEKYKLSPEHPGLAVNPTLNGTTLSPMSLLGLQGLPIRWHQYGPKFFDKPLNEGTFEKVACAAKYTAIFMIPYTIAHIRATQCIQVKDFTPAKYFRQYLKLSPFPMAIATSWAFSISAVSSIRNKDDLTNHFFAGPAVGLVVAAMKDNIAMGLVATGIVTFFGMFWQYQRASEFGLLGKVANPTTSGFHGGPLAWQLLQHGDVKVPDHTF